MEAVSQIYTASLIAGPRAWYEGSQMLVDDAWRYYREWGTSSDMTAQQWKSRLENDVRKSIRDLENLQIQFKAEYEKSSFRIIEETFK